ncbi:hypothetical protein [Tenggerimyces flavus]|uniref:Uncharacterized protein n=1 Tax=Tenggerimyces flavus TaxID=1708749 RepID=A0ABV7Y3F5_9ACTN|nr:hypothetical protein [Tenggerimyces flavus]MBM7788665.1 hypothetical protein [Tenggerimyces flavus]
MGGCDGILVLELGGCAHLSLEFTTERTVDVEWTSMLGDERAWVRKEAQRALVALG